MIDVIGWMGKFNTVKRFLETFKKKDTRIQEIYNSKLENRLQTVLESTVEYCIYRFNEELPDEMVRFILENEGILEAVVDGLFKKNFIWDDKYLIQGYGLDKDTQKSFVEFFFFALQNSMQRDLEIRRALRETGVYFEIDQIYDMTTLIYNKIGKIDEIHSIVSRINEIITLGSTSVNNNIVQMKFYLHDLIDFSEETDSITVKALPDIKQVYELKEKIKDIVPKIHAIKLEKPVRQEEEPVKEEQPINGEEISLLKGLGIDKVPSLLKDLENEKLKAQLANFSIQKKVYTSLSNEDKNEIVERLKLLNIEIDEDTFFCAGGLKQSSFPISNVFTGITDMGYEGTNAERAKWELIKDLQSFVYLLKQYGELKDYLKDYKVIPLIITNEGKVHNKNIEVKIKLPKEVDIFQTPDEMLAVLSYTATYDDERFFDSILCPESDDKVSVCAKPSYNDYFEKRQRAMRRSHHEIIEDETRHIQNLYNFAIYKGNEYNTISMFAGSIKPNEKKALPIYILVKADNNFEIKYEILSEQSVNNDFRPLLYKISEHL